MFEPAAIVIVPVFVIVEYSFLSLSEAVANDQDYLISSHQKNQGTESGRRALDVYVAQDLK